MRHAFDGRTKIAGLNTITTSKLFKVVFLRSARTIRMLNRY